MKIIDVNDAPTDITVSGSSTVLVNENTKSALLGDLRTVDEDNNQTHTYTLISNNGGNFVVRGNKLYVSNSANLNYEVARVISIVVRSLDSGNPPKFVDKTIRIDVGDVNESPTAITLSHYTVTENSPVGTVIGSLLVTDPDANQTHKCQLLDSGNGRMAIENREKIELTVGGAGVNYEDTASVNVSVRCWDQGDLATEQDFHIVIININEAPTEVKLSNNKVNENLNADTVVGLLTTVDPDNTNVQQQTFAYSLVSHANSSPFAIKGNTVVTKRRLDYENVPQWNIIVRVQDSGTPVKYSTHSFTILVQDVNDAPDSIVVRRLL